jgi:hypothetical protein
MKRIPDFFLPSENTARKLAGKVRVSGPGRSFPTLLCMNRAVLSSDLKAMGTRTALNFATISAAAFEALLSPHVPKGLQEQTFYQKTYLQSNPALKQKLKSIVAVFLRETEKYIPFSAVIVANSDYWQDEVLKDVCKEKSIPFIVLCRENYAVKYEQDLLRTRIKKSEFAYGGNAIAVASDMTRDIMLSTGGYEKEAVVTVGWPRFDSWLNVKQASINERPFITLVSYQQKNYLAPRNFEATLREFVKAAKASGKADQFCIKLKKPAHLRSLLLSCPQLLFSGIKIVSKQPLDELLQKSRMVIGYNTTGILEAYLTECAVVVPWWDDAVRTVYDCLVVKNSQSDSDTTYFPETPTAFAELIQKSLAGKLAALGSREERIEQFKRFVFFDKNESASSRFEALVRKHINA